MKLRSRTVSKLTRLYVLAHRDGGDLLRANEHQGDPFLAFSSRRAALEAKRHWEPECELELKVVELQVSR